ncbi:hypothetical protein DK412_04440 [Methylobacterium sp. 17Sr1-1]|nr:hypothetical protein DK412_04440 [Methylobacterium sp. 17Sr1-1]
MRLVMTAFHDDATLLGFSKALCDPPVGMKNVLTLVRTQLRAGIIGIATAPFDLVGVVRQHTAPHLEHLSECLGALRRLSLRDDHTVNFRLG